MFSRRINSLIIIVYLLLFQVNTRNEWSALCEQFHLPGGCVNSGVGLKQIYLRYVDVYFT